MLNPEALRNGPSGDEDIDFLKYPHNGVDPREYLRDSDVETGDAVIKMIQESFAQNGTVFSVEDMLASVRTSLNLTDEEFSQIVPSPNDETQVRETFIGFVYLGSIFKPEAFEQAMRLESANHNGSHLDLIKTMGVKPVVGEIHRIFNYDGGS